MAGSAVRLPALALFSTVKGALLATALYAKKIYTRSRKEQPSPPPEEEQDVAGEPIDADLVVETAVEQHRVQLDNLAATPPLTDSSGRRLSHALPPPGHSYTHRR